MRPVSCLASLCALAFAAPLQMANAASPHSIQISPLGSYASGLFDQSAAEIVAHDPASQRLFVVNAASGKIDVLDIRSPAQPSLLFVVDLSAYGAVVNSVAVHQGLIAAAVENSVKTSPGQVVFLNVEGQVLASVEVGALPDMLTFTPNGKHVLVANEGEPNDDYSIDPEGSVSIIDLPQDIRQLTQAQVRTAGFQHFQRADLDASIRITGPNASVAQDLEPEYITVSEDSTFAWVALQENNALAKLDIRSGRFVSLRGLGFKDHSLAGNELDASDRDNGINIRNWPVLGMYQPDSIASYQYRGNTYVVSANEGDARAYAGFNEEIRVGNAQYRLNPELFPDAASLKQNANLGRLTVSRATGYNPQTGYYDGIYAFGGRSFSIWSDREARWVYDSGADFERIVAAHNPQFFNSNHRENSLDSRSDDKGPEPEGVTLAKLWGKTYAFVGLERVGGVMVYDISNPYAPGFVQYLNNRDFSATPGTPAAGDLGAEGLTVISAEHSPLRDVPLLVVANEVSGTTTLYRIDRQKMTPAAGR
jgi:DNA-binding beta-propeller fold protein YncE